MLTAIQGYITASYQMSPVKAYPHAFSSLHKHIIHIPSSHNQSVILTSGSAVCKLCRHPFIPRSHSESLLCMPSLTNTFGSRGFQFISHKQTYRGRFRMHVGIDVATAVEVINDLGFDTLTFLAVTVMVVPAFKIIRASPVSFCIFIFS